MLHASLHVHSNASTSSNTINGVLCVHQTNLTFHHKGCETIYFSIGVLIWYTGWANGTLCGCQRSCLVYLFCGCVLSSVHLIKPTFAFSIIMWLWCVVIAFFVFPPVWMCLCFCTIQWGCCPPYHICISITNYYHISLHSFQRGIEPTTVYLQWQTDGT